MSSKQSRETLQLFTDLIAAFKRHSKRVHLDPQVEEVHQLRIIVRRLRSLLWIFRHGSNIRVGTKIQRELRAWGRALGERREFDVLIHDSSHFRLDSSPFQLERKDANAHLHRVISLKRRQDALKRLRKVEERLRECPQLHRQKVLMRAYREYFPVLDPWPKKIAELHRVRIQSKKMRYVLEAFNQPTEPLHQFASALGRVHDLEILKQKLE